MSGAVESPETRNTIAELAEGVFANGRITQYSA
jgi:hypothetical protein